MMKHIVVTKFGNEPDIFGETLRAGMIGDWETRQLILALASDENTLVTYYGKAIWDEEKARNIFPKTVQFIECSSSDSPKAIKTIANIDEFHVILGPHAFYNGGSNIPSWESIKKSIVTERLLERVAPQIRLMNEFKDAKKFFYLSDRRFLLQAADFNDTNAKIYAQSISNASYVRPVLGSDYSELKAKRVDIRPCRFETLWLLGKNKEDYFKNLRKPKPKDMVVPANQVTSDDEIANSRLDKLMEFTDYVRRFTVVGKWTQAGARKMIKNSTSCEQFLDGLAMKEYMEELSRHKYALVLFNTKDGPQVFDNNWITLKYWECVFAGCLTFVECGKEYLDFIPKELQVRSGKELNQAYRACDTSPSHFKNLLDLQTSLLKDEYFTSEYFTSFLNKERRDYEKQ